MRAGISTRLVLPVLAALPFAAALARGGVTPGAIMALEVSIVALFCATVLLSWRDLGPRIGIGDHDLPVAALLVLAAASWLWSTYRGSTRLELLLWLALAIFYLLCSTYLIDRQSIRRFAWWLAAGGAFFALFALVLTGGHLMGLATFARRTGYWTSFTFVNHNHFAGFVAPLALVALGLAMAVRGAARIAALTLAFTGSLAVLASLSRGGMLSLGVGFLFLLATFRATGSRRRTTFLLSALGILLFAVALLDLEPVRDRLETLSDLQSASAHRAQIWATSLDMIGDAPWLGSGLGTYRHRWPLHQDGAMKSALHAHNDYLELASELGIIGLVLFVFTTFWIFLRTLPPLLASRDTGIQGIGLGALAALVYWLAHGLTDFNSHIPSNALLYAACAAMAIRSAAYARKTDTRRWWLTGEILQKSHSLPSILIVLTVAFFAGQAVLPWLAFRKAQEAELAFWEGRLEDAARSYEVSLSLLPDQFEAAAALGDVRLAAAYGEQDIGAPTSAYDRALRACPSCLATTIAKGHALEITDSPATAEAQFRKAFEIARNSPSPTLQLGLFLLREHRWSEAQSKLRHALFLANGSEETYRLVFREIERLEGLSTIAEALPIGVEPQILHAKYLVEREAYAYAAQRWGEIVARDDSAQNIRAHLEALSMAEDRVTAKRYAASYAEAYPEHLSVLLLSAALLADGDDTAESLAILEFVLEQDQGNVRARVLLARLFCQGEEPVRGLDLLAEGLSESPFQTDFLMEEATCCLRTHRFERALASAKKAVELAPDDPRALFTLGQIYLGLRLDQQAADSWTRCLEVSPQSFACKSRLERLRARLAM